MASKIFLLVVIFLVVPIILYQLFQTSDARQVALLERTVEEKGTLIASLVKPHLLQFQTESPDELQRALDEVATEGTSIKILVRPEGSASSGGFLYVAASPTVSADYLEQEREQLVKLGVFDRLAPSCDGESTSSLRFTNPAGRPEVLTSMTTVHVGKSCWVVITTQATQAILSSSIGQSVWQTPTLHIAALVYLLSAVIVAWLFIGMWRNLDRFRTAARKIRSHDAGNVSFREMNTIPELNGVADDFDALVTALKQSKEFIVQAAEENAHAFKAPLAVIAQAIEPLKRTAADDQHAQRSIELIERSTARLDLLVSAARDLEQAAAEDIYTSSRPINLSSYLSQLITAYEPTLIAEGKYLDSMIEPGVHAYATEEAMESIIENLLENAASFTEPGGTVEVVLRTSDSEAHLTIADNGPGVPQDHLPLIFERYFTARANGGAATDAGQADHHSGLGLWIVRRNVEGLGGHIAACNREDGGFAVTASLRAAT
jgi:two-component system sensor histidine kinase ChvG